MRWFYSYTHGGKHKYQNQGASMKVKKGAPKRYIDLVKALSDEQLYSPAAIARFGIQNRLINREKSVADKVVIVRVRTIFCKCAIRYLPAHSDGFIRIARQRLSPAWYGWRWKQAYVHDIFPQIKPKEKAVNHEKLIKKI